MVNIYITIIVFQGCILWDIFNIEKEGMYMSFCANCGQRLKDGEQMCANCGQVVRQATEDKIPAFEVSQNTSFIEKLKKTKRNLLITISAVIICSVIGGIGIAKYIKASQIRKRMNLGNKYLQEQQYEEAIFTFENIIKMEPENIEARVELAKVYTKTENLVEAEKILKEAISINPQKEEPYLEIAKIYISSNNPFNAIKSLINGSKATNDKSINALLEELKSKITVTDINKTITLGENYSLPSKVTVMINNVSGQFPVKWDRVAIDTTKLGTSTFNGTLENIDKVIKATLNVITIASIGDINNTINRNDKYSLPSKITAKMTDSSTREVEITWSPSTVDTSKTGTYSYLGTVIGYKGKVKLTLNINKAIISREQAYKILIEKVKPSPADTRIYYYCDIDINGRNMYEFLVDSMYPGGDITTASFSYCVDIYQGDIYQYWPLSPESHIVDPKVQIVQIK